jgi:preprotein translocase subunit SecG
MFSTPAFICFIDVNDRCGFGSGEVGISFAEATLPANMLPKIIVVMILLFILIVFCFALRM